MPEFTYQDRVIIEAEGALWSILEAFKGATAELDGEFSGEALAVRESIQKFAQSLRDYNDQFETTDD